MVIGTEAGICHRCTMPDSGFYLPFAALKPTNFGGALARSCHKEFAIAAEACICHRNKMLDFGFYLPFAVDRPTNFDGAIARSCHKVFSIGAEVDIIHNGIMLNGGFFLRLIVDKLPEFGVVKVKAARVYPRGYRHKVFSIGTELGICKKPPRILDDDFLLPLVVLKPPDFADAITKGCHKVVSIGAEASTHHSCRMPEGNFFPPLAALKLPEFGGVIVRDCHKEFAVGTEAIPLRRNTYRMAEDDFFPPLAALKLPEFGVVVEVMVKDCQKVFSIRAEAGISHYA